MSTATERDAAKGGAAERIPPSRKRTASTGLREGRAAWVLALPFLLLFLVFTIWPVIQSLYMSFTDTKAKDLRDPFSVDFIGIENFTRASNMVLVLSLRRRVVVRRHVRTRGSRKP